MSNPITWLRAYYQRPRCPICRKRRKPDALKFKFETCSPDCFVQAQKLMLFGAMIGLNPWKAAAEQP